MWFVQFRRSPLSRPSAAARLATGLALGATCIVVLPGAAHAATPTVTVSPTSAAPGTALTVTGGGWTAGDAIFVQIGSTTFDTDVVCVLTAATDGTIIGNKPQFWGALPERTCPWAWSSRL